MTGPFVRPDVRAHLDLLATLPGPQYYEMDAPAARVMTGTLGPLADLPMRALAVRRDLEMPGPAGNSIRLRLYDDRAERGPGPIIVFYHGGGFVLGDLDLYDSACAEIAHGLDLPVVSVDYRLAPEHPWPAGADDAEAAARWIAENGEAISRTATGLVLAGDSAGGALAIVTAIALRDRPAAVRLLALWPLYPAVELRRRYPSTEEFGEGYMLTAPALLWFNQCYQPDFKHWRASPLRADQKGLPPTLVATASLDPLLDQGRAYAIACVDAGVPTVYREAKGNIHGWLTLRKAIPSSQADLAGCLTVLKQMIAETTQE